MKIRRKRKYSFKPPDRRHSFPLRRFPSLPSPQLLRLVEAGIPVVSAALRCHPLLLSPASEALSRPLGPCSGTRTEPRPPGRGPGAPERPVPRPGAGAEPPPRRCSRGPAGVTTAPGSPLSRRHDAIPARDGRVVTSQRWPVTQLQRAPPENKSSWARLCFGRAAVATAHGVAAGH